MQFSANPEGLNPDQASLGGKLFYAGEIGDATRPMIVAANIAGAATLTASAQQPTLRQAQHDGLIDFQVNSLDEALRILKNEIRKHQPVAVAVSVSSQAIEAEMLERGVLPDLLPSVDPSPHSVTRFADFLEHGAQRIPTASVSPDRKLRIWPIPAEFIQRPAAFEDLLLEHLPSGDHLNRRWLRLSSRYLGHEARKLRSLACNSKTASELIERFGKPIEP
jgi:urocanate hydratase